MKRVLFVVALALALVVGVSSAADFNGDGTGDIAIFRESSGLWSVRGVSRFYFGTTGDLSPNPVIGREAGPISRPSSGVAVASGLSEDSAEFISAHPAT